MKGSRSQSHSGITLSRRENRGQVFSLSLVTIAILWVKNTIVSFGAPLEKVDLLQLPDNEFDGFKLGIAGDHENRFAEALNAQPLGDVNGDGIDDFMSMKWLPPTGRAPLLNAAVFFGRSSAYPKVQLVGRDEDWSFFKEHVMKSNNIQSLGLFKLGDVNGDGLDDLMMVGKARMNQSEDEPTRAYILYGSREAKRQVNASSLDGQIGFEIRMPATSSGTIVGCGDFNNDGISDIVSIQPPTSADDQQFGKSYVIFGSKTRQEPALDLSKLNDSDGFIIENIKSPFATFPIGDLNGDGFHEAGIGDGSILYGNSSTLPADPSTMRFTKVIGNDKEDTPLIVRGVGDFNGDGLSDTIAYFPPGSAEVTQSAIIFGNPDGLPALLHINELEGSNGFILEGVKAGVGIGDFNGDNIDDILTWDCSTMQYLLFGKVGQFMSRITVSSPDGISGVAFTGLQGAPASALGDVNNDGIADVLIRTNEYNVSRYLNLLPPTAVFRKGTGKSHQPNKNTSGELGTGAIVGISFGVAIAVSAIGVVLWWFLRRYRGVGSSDSAMMRLAPNSEGNMESQYA